LNLFSDIRETGQSDAPAFFPEQRAMVEAGSSHMPQPALQIFPFHAQNLRLESFSAIWRGARAPPLAWYDKRLSGPDRSLIH